jgi:transposase
MVVVIDRMGERVLNATRVRVGQNERLLALLAPYHPAEVVMETSASWPWLFELLRGDGLQCVLAHARRLRAIAEANYKRDEIDAELLARMRLAGLIPEVYATPAMQREWATLIRHRITLVAQRTRLVNRLHAQLHAHGLHLERGRLLTRAGRQWLRTDAWPHWSLEERAVARSHLRIIAGLRSLIRDIDRHIAAVAATIPEARLLATIPGIGPQRALVICAEALPIQRFFTPGHLASYAGLVPRSKQSGLSPIKYGEIPAGANRWLRGALVRAVVSHVQSAPNSWLTRYYLTQKERLGWPTARVAAARKLARAIHAMLRTTRPWTDNPPSRGELVRTHAAETA